MSNSTPFFTAYPALDGHFDATSGASAPLPEQVLRDRIHGQHPDTVRRALLQSGIAGVAALRAAGVRAGVLDLATRSGRGLLPLALASQVAGISVRQLRRYIRSLEAAGVIQTRRTRRGLRVDSLRTRGERYGRVPLSAVHALQGHPELWALFAWLDDRDCGEGGASLIVSDAEIAEAWGMHRTTAGRLMRELEAAGLVIIEGRGEERAVTLCAGAPTRRHEPSDPQPSRLRADLADPSLSPYRPIRPISRSGAPFGSHSRTWQAPLDRDRDTRRRTFAGNAIQSTEGDDSGYVALHR